jgi:hypothetical protein
MKTHGMKFTPRDETGCTDANNQNIDVLFRLHEAIKGTRQIRVILYAKGEPFCAPPPADELPVEDILAVEHGVIPLDGADVFQWREIESIGDRVALLRPGDFLNTRRPLQRASDSYPFNSPKGYHPIAAGSLG